MVNHNDCIMKCPKAHRPKKRIQVKAAPANLMEQFVTMSNLLQSLIAILNRVTINALTKTKLFDLVPILCLEMIVTNTRHVLEISKKMMPLPKD